MHLVANTQAGYYHKLPDTLSATKQAVQTMDLSHKQYAPTPKSIRWWISTAILLCLGVWQRLMKSSMHLGGGGGSGWVMPVQRVTLYLPNPN